MCILLQIIRVLEDKIWAPTRSISAETGFNPSIFFAGFVIGNVSREVIRQMSCCRIMLSVDYILKLWNQ